ncbi:MAG TPA: hypothetical protein VH397_14750 [Xanthobacteraceae bacterium]
MSVILSLLGIVVAAAGLAAIGFGIPINEFTLGTTLLVTGTTALTGGLILIGLAAAVGELGRVADALKTRPVARPAARAAETPEPIAPALPGVVAAPAPPAGVGSRPAAPGAPVAQRPRIEPPAREARPPRLQPAAPSSAVDVSAGAIERLRSTIPRTERPKVEPSVVAEGEEVPLSPSEAVPQQPASRPAGSEAAPLAPKITAEDRAGGAAVEALKASRLDFLFRSKPARPAPAPPSLESFPPADDRAREARPPTSAEPEAETASAQSQDQPEQASPEPQDRQPEAAPAAEPPAAAILKSGVVDGMAYTLYADGSIEAKLPHGTVRFGSIAELRAHIESNS